MDKFTISNIGQYLSAGESDTLEVKAGIPRDWNIIEKTISAFANTNGGSIIFGCNDETHEIIGIDSIQINRIKSRLNDSQHQKYCSFYTVKIGEKELGILDVKKAKSDIYVNNIAYTRSGTKVFSKINAVRSRHLRNFIHEIQYCNRNPKNVKVLDLLNDISTNPEKIFPPGTLLYRCRVIQDMSKIGKEPGFWGYGKKDSFVPPVDATRDLRANYRYIPYLYCANHPYTAMVEVRPRLGSDISIATIELRKELVLLDFTLNHLPSRITESKKKLMADLSMLFSKPVTSDDDILDYIPTQYIAEFAKQLGYDGITFRSSLTPELDAPSEEFDRYNVVIFNYQHCAPIKSNIFTITRNFLECEQSDHDTSRLAIHNTLINM